MVLEKEFGPEYPNKHREGESHRIYSVQFDSRYLFIGGQDREILCYDFAGGDEGMVEAVDWLKYL